MATTESLGAEVKRRRDELTAYYNKLYQEDEEFVEKLAEEHIEDLAIEDMDSDQIEQALKDAFKAGWKRSIIQPPTKAIHLISMYAYDYIPWYISVNVKNTVTCIRDIFRQKLYPEGGITE